MKNYDEARHWVQIDTQAQEYQKAAFDAALEERSVEFQKRFAEYKASRVCKSNGVLYEAWEMEFVKSVFQMGRGYELGYFVPAVFAHAAYDRDETPGVAALNWLEQEWPEPPDPELEAQKAYVAKTTAELMAQDVIHNEKVKRLHDPVV